MFAVFLTAMPVKAVVLTDWQTGSQIVVPDEWKTSFTPPEYPGFGARSYDPRYLPAVDFDVDDETTTVPLTEKSKFVEETIQNVEAPVSGIPSQWTLDRQSARTLNGNDFLVLSMSKKMPSGTNYINAWFVIVKGHTCRIFLRNKDADPDKSDILNGIIKSFTITDRVQSHSTILSAQAQQDEFLKNNPFSFFGKVIDENGMPVAGAIVKMEIGGELGSTQGTTEHNLQSDENGLFKMENVHGMDVDLSVSKVGYYTLPNEHEGAWYGPFYKRENDSMPTKDQPAIFTLKMQGATEPLIVMRNRSAVVSTDGTPLEFNLERGHVVQGQPGTFQVQTWVDAHDPKSNQQVHWKFRITVPGGGLQVRTNEYQFVAPSLGYKEVDEAEMIPGQLGGGDVQERQYFVKLPDGKYARVRVSVNAYGSFGIEDGFINPSGSQNLEFDPSKKIKPTP